MSGARKKAQATVAAAGKKRKSAVRADEDESQTIVDDAAADAEAEQAMVKETDQSATGASGSGASGGGSAARLPAGLLERRLAKERKEKDELAAKLLELQNRVAQSEMVAQSPRSASAPKVIIERTVKV